MQLLIIKHLSNAFRICIVLAQISFAGKFLLYFGAVWICGLISVETALTGTFFTCWKTLVCAIPAVGLDIYPSRVTGQGLQNGSNLINPICMTWRSPKIQSFLISQRTVGSNGLDASNLNLYHGSPVHCFLRFSAMTSVDVVNIIFL